MSELEDKLNSILSDPQTMSQIMSLAKSLGGASSTAESGPPEEMPPAAPRSAPAEQENTRSVPDLSALFGALSGEADSGPDPRLLTLASRVMEECGRKDDKKTALLNALRPYVREKRYAKLDKAIQIGRLSRLIRVALEAFKGGEYV